ncbi:P-loop containing nucleoside triphosphate hydrolase protein [Hysterangium stoloniferum]|nr:P-loop containing nucleoside triphosphate hydrolase protein [Hysterangium stoloniferum]
MQHIVSNACIPLSAYLKAQGVPTKLKDELRTYHFDHHEDKVASSVKIGLSEFKWSDVDFIVYKITWSDALGSHFIYVLVFRGDGEDDSEKRKIGEDLLNCAYKWNVGLKDEIFVFSDGHWMKDKNLWTSIQAANWDSLVLDTNFIAGLKRDTETFFSSREVYKSLGIPWKRGLLLLGPPGNGKTESIKVLLKESGIPSLYVRSFNTNRGAESGIRAIFEFARKRSPCLLVLEDLDSMVTPAVRSFFLNELDGLEHNEGILTIATSNHPERIDDAILNRPSRFDVKYTFGLPTYELRKAYVEKWIKKIQDLHGIRFENELFIKEMAEQTEGFSFAFMKELFISFLLRVAHDKSAGLELKSPESTMKAQIKQLVVQIKTGKEAKEENSQSSGRGGDYFGFPPAFVRHRDHGMFGGLTVASDW